MSDTQLYYFMTVARVGNITKAAELLHVTQPSLSNAIARLEDEVGVKLFDRIGKNKIQLNKFGRVFLEHTSRAASEYTEGLRQIRSMDDPFSGSIVFSTPNVGVFEYLVEQFLTDRPDVHIAHRHYSLAEIQDAKFQGNLDFAISYFQCTENKLNWTPICQQQVGAVVSSQHPLFGRLSVPWTDLKNEKFAYLSVNSEMSDICSNICHQVGFRQDIVYEGSPPHIMANRIQQGSLIMLMPEMEYHLLRLDPHCPLFKNNDFSFIRLTEPTCELSLGLIRMNARYIPKAAQECIAFFTDKLSSIYREYSANR